MTTTTVLVQRGEPDTEIARHLAARIQRNGRIHDAWHRELYESEIIERDLIVKALQQYAGPSPQPFDPCGG